MGRQATVRLLALFVLPVAVGLAPSSAHADVKPLSWENLLKNGGFEEVHGGRPAYWDCTGGASTPPPPPASNEFLQLLPDPDPAQPRSTRPKPLTLAPSGPIAPTPDAPVPPHGENLPYFGTSVLSGRPTISDNAACTQVVKVEENTKYELSGWFAGSNSYLATEYESVWSPKTATGWTQLHSTFTTAPGATSLRVAVHGWYGSSAFNADVIELTKADRGKRVPMAMEQLIDYWRTSGAVMLKWQGVPGATAYRITQDGASLGVTTAHSMLVQGLLPGTRYSFTATPLNPAGAGEAAGVKVATNTPDAAPPVLPCPSSCPVVTSNPAKNVIHASWNRVTGATDGYAVYLDGVRVGWIFGDRVKITKVPAGLHRVQIAALNSAGKSGLSTPAYIVVAGS